MAALNATVGHVHGHLPRILPCSELTISQRNYNPISTPSISRPSYLLLSPSNSRFLDRHSRFAERECAQLGFEIAAALIL